MIIATWPVCRRGMDGTEPALSLMDVELRLLRYLAAAA